jgi:hypothetical protein
MATSNITSIDATDDRQRFLQIARFERTDDPFVYQHWFWLEALERWRTEGMPADANPFEVLSLGQDRLEFLPVTATTVAQRPYGNPPWPIAIDPPFEREVLEDEGETEIVREIDGGISRYLKSEPTRMPQFIEYPVKDRAGWEAYKPRFSAHSPNRFKPGWQVISHTNFSRDPELLGRPWSERNFPLGIQACSLFGIYRDMMGIEAISLALYDDPSLVVDMMDHNVEYTIALFEQIFAAGIKLDFVNMWEDMCYKAGLLISPRIVKELMVPRYRIVTDYLRSHGIDVIILDCDGYVEEFIPLLIEGGINGMFPFEVQAGMDPISVRKRYGKNLIMLGGIDKRALAEGKAAIDGEVEKAQ